MMADQPQPSSSHFKEVLKRKRKPRDPQVLLLPEASRLAKYHVNFTLPTMLRLCLRGGLEDWKRLSNLILSRTGELFESRLELEIAFEEQINWQHSMGAWDKALLALFRVMHACRPCRERKVKCDRQWPCDACTKRKHPEICTFSAPDLPQDSDMSPSEDSSQVSIPRDELDKAQDKLNGIAKDVADLQVFFSKYNGTSQLQSPKMPSSSILSSPQEQSEPSQSSAPRQSRRYQYGSNYEKGMDLTEYNESTDEYHHIGGGSSAALAKALGKAPKDRGDRRRFQEIFGKNMSSRFGLETTNATYPFTNLWDDSDGQTRLRTLLKVLPSMTDCLETVRRFFRDSNITYPTLTTQQRFEKELKGFFARYNVNSQTMIQGELEEQKLDEKLFRWLGLFFAVLASGTQFTSEPTRDIPHKDTQHLSQIFCYCSFECLKMVDYLAFPTVEVVHTFFILSTVLANGMKARSAWNVLGLTLRLGVDIGLDTAAERATKSESERPKSELWWAILWADSALSLGFGRTACAPQSEFRFTPADPTEDADGWSYIQCMQRLTKMSYSAMHSWVSQQSLQSRLAKCTQLRNEVDQLQRQASIHLRDVNECTSYQEECEHWRLSLRAAYIKSEFCRLAVVPGTPELDKDNTLRGLYIRYLVETVEAFNGLARAAKVQTRSWDALHPALSACILLSILKEMKPGSPAHTAVHELIDLMRERVGVEQGGEYLGPMARSISALLIYCGEEETIPSIMSEVAQVPRASNRSDRTTQPESSPTKPSNRNVPALSLDNSIRHTNEVPLGVRPRFQASNARAPAQNQPMPASRVENEPDISCIVGQDAGSVPLTFQNNEFLTSMYSGNELDSGPFHTMQATFWGNGTQQQPPGTSYPWGGPGGPSGGGSAQGGMGEDVIMSSPDVKECN